LNRRQGDNARQYGPFKNGKSAYFVSVNRGKESIALDLKSRVGHQGALRAEIESVLRTEGTDHWIAVLEAAGVPCGPVNDSAQALAHPQTGARNMLISVDDGVTGRLELAGNPMKLSGFADPPTRQPAPDLDADRDQILRELGL
jgi:CoA:oxalate CoA-transferase